MAVTRLRNQWYVDFYTDDGKRIRRRSPKQTERGAKRYETQLRQEFAVGVNGSSTSMPSSPEATAFQEFAVEWLSTYAVANNRPSEVVAKESILRLHLIPFFFDNSDLSAIGAQDIERYKAEKLATLSAKSVSNHLVVLRKLLVTAIEWGLLEKLPPIKRPRVPPAKFDWLTSEESERYLAAVDAHYPQWSGLMWTALRTGMRRGELFGLFWDDIDLVARIVTVRRSVFRGKLVPPKSGKERTIPLSGQLTAVLKDHRAATMLRGDLVFPAKKGGIAKHHDHVERPLRGALKRAGLRRIKFHELRHSFASQLVSAGRPLKEVQELLGHASMAMTLRYAHLAPDRMRDAVDALDTKGAESRFAEKWDHSGIIARRSKDKAPGLATEGFA